MSIKDWLNLLAPLATAIGVCVAASQLWVTKRQAVTTFEDSLAHEYRQITGRLPTEALLGEILSPDLQKAHFHEFYRYFDLTNSQIFLRQCGRINKKTWKFWVEGIQTNLARPAFAANWTNISGRAGGDFAELRRLIAEDFQADPRRW